MAQLQNSGSAATSDCTQSSRVPPPHCTVASLPAPAPSAACTSTRRTRSRKLARTRAPARAGAHCARCAALSRSLSVVSTSVWYLLQALLQHGRGGEREAAVVQHLSGERTERCKYVPSTRHRLPQSHRSAAQRAATEPVFASAGDRLFSVGRDIDFEQDDGVEDPTSDPPDHDVENDATARHSRCGVDFLDKDNTAVSLSLLCLACACLSLPFFSASASPLPRHRPLPLPRSASASASASASHCLWTASASR